MACDMIEISHHIDANHKQACSDLEKASLFIAEALQSEIQRNTTLFMLIHRLEERAAENGRSLSEQVESNQQLKLHVDELQKQLEDKDNSLTQAKQSIAVLKNELGDLKRQLQSHQSNHRTTQTLSEWQQDESLTNIVKAEDGVQQNGLVAVKEEDADDGYPFTQSDGTDTSTEQTHSSSAGIRTEQVQEEDEKLDMTPVVSSDPDPVKFLRLSVQLVDCCATQGQQRTTSQTPHQCTVCNRGFTHLGQLTAHQRLHTGEKPYYCGQCGKTFTEAAKLRTHQVLHSVRKPHQCGQCGRRFTLLANFTEHLLLHTGVRPYQCGQCGRSFMYAGFLRNHKRIHKGERPLQCPECGRRYKTWGNLKKHQRYHTAHKPAQNEQNNL